MKKLSLIVLLLSSTILAPSTANAAGQIKYTNQKVGQFCKTSEIGKATFNPAGDRLQCVSGESKARWQYKPLEVKYVAQKAGQFCKKVDLNKFTLESSGNRLFCRLVDGRARWVQE